jgi:hypothetical protein
VRKRELGQQKLGSDCEEDRIGSGDKDNWARRRRLLGQEKESTGPRRRREVDWDRRKRERGEEEERTGRGGREDWARRKRELREEKERTGRGGRED